MFLHYMIDLTFYNALIKLFLRFNSHTITTD